MYVIYSTWLCAHIHRYKQADIHNIYRDIHIYCRDLECTITFPAKKKKSLTISNLLLPNLIALEFSPDINTEILFSDNNFFVLIDMIGQDYILSRSIAHTYFYIMHYVCILTYSITKFIEITFISECVSIYMPKTFFSKNCNTQRKKKNKMKTSEFAAYKNKCIFPCDFFCVCDTVICLQDL